MLKEILPKNGPLFREFKPKNPPILAAQARTISQGALPALDMLCIPLSCLFQKVPLFKTDATRILIYSFSIYISLFSFVFMFFVVVNFKETGHLL